MGILYLEHPGGLKIVVCEKCSTPLTNKEHVISTRFTGATGRATLYHKVVNIKTSELQDRMMLTGRHLVRDVMCVVCDAKLGWMYEFAMDETQRYKEGKVILERALVREEDGYPDPLIPTGNNTGNHQPISGVTTGRSH